MPLQTQTHGLTALVTLAAVLVYFWMGLQVGRGRGKYGIAAPAMTGNPDFERLVRVQMNTLEWLPIFLTSLWLFAIYGSELIAAALGAVWVVGRILYMIGYTRAAGARSAGFLVQMAAAAALFFGAAFEVVAKLL